MGEYSCVNQILALCQTCLENLFNFLTLLPRMCFLTRTPSSLSCTQQPQQRWSECRAPGRVRQVGPFLTGASLQTSLWAQPHRLQGDRDAHTQGREEKQTGQNKKGQYYSQEQSFNWFEMGGGQQSCQFWSSQSKTIQLISQIWQLF